MTLTTSVLTDLPAIAELIPEWDALSRKDPRSTPYQSGSLTIGIGGLFAAAGTPYIVIARARTGELVGVLPLRRLPAQGRLGGWCLTPYVEWHASYFDSIVDPDTPGAGEALHGALQAKRDWDRCDFRFLRPDATLMQAHGNAEVATDGGTQSIRREAYLQATTTGHGKPHKAERRLSKAGAVLFTADETPDQLEHALRQFGTMHTGRWRGAGQAEEFADPTTIDRLIHFLFELGTSGLSRVGTIRLSGEIIAVHLAFRWQGVQFSWRMAHDRRWEEMSPGRLLMSLMIEEAFASGCLECDLGRGLDSYKQRWPTDRSELSRLILRGATWRGRLWQFRARR